MIYKRIARKAALLALAAAALHGGCRTPRFVGFDLVADGCAGHHADAGGHRTARALAE